MCHQHWLFRLTWSVLWHMQQAILPSSVTFILGQYKYISGNVERRESKQPACLLLEAGFTQCARSCHPAACK